MTSSRIVAVLAGIVFVIAGVQYYTHRAPAPGTEHIIRYSKDGFSPAELTIRQGDTVTFQNDSSEFFWPASDLHPTHLLYPDFDPKEPIESGKSWSFQFMKTGSWKYHNHLAPYFTGTITVQNEKN